METDSNDIFDSIRMELNKIISESLPTEATKPSELPSSYVRFNNKIHPDSLQRLETSENSKRAKFIQATASVSIDEDVKNMRKDLIKSYELLQTAGEAFDSLNFNCLKYRIRDLHLTASHAEMNAVLEEKTVGDSLNKLTDVMGHKFRQHPGEFGDIPELSTFFKACSQLQHGLDALKRQRSEMNELGRRMMWATKASTDRLYEIQKAIKDEEKKTTI